METKNKTLFYDRVEWKYDQDKMVVIVRDLYGFKSSGLAWRNHLEEFLGNYMEFTSSPTYPGVWFKVWKDKDVNQYCTYILVYVDDIPIVNKDPRKFISMLMDKYTIKPLIIMNTKI